MRSSAIDGDQSDIGFKDLNRTVSLSTQGQVIHFLVKRPDVEKPLDFPIVPTREAAGDRPTIGVKPNGSLNVFGYQPPAGTVDPPTFPWGGEPDAPLQDTIVAAGLVGEPSISVADYQSLRLISAQNRDKPLELTIEHRPLKPQKGASTPERSTVVLPPNRFVDFGFRLRAEPIRAIQKDSPAETAGFRAGDRIVRVDGRDDFDPIRLATECFDHAGQPMTFEVERTEKGGTEPKTVSLTVTPVAAPPTFDPVELVSSEDFEISSLGLCFPIRPKIEAVRPDSPAAKAGLKPGDVINALIFPKTQGKPRGLTDAGQDVWLISREQTLNFDDKAFSWPYAFGVVQSLPIQPVGFTINNSSTPVSLTPEIAADWFNPDRGLEFEPATRTVPPLAPAGGAQGRDERDDRERHDALRVDPQPVLRPGEHQEPRRTDPDRAGGVLGGEQRSGRPPLLPGVHQHQPRRAQLPADPPA